MLFLQLLFSMFYCHLLLLLLSCCVGKKDSILAHEHFVQVAFYCKQQGCTDINAFTFSKYLVHDLSWVWSMDSHS